MNEEELRLSFEKLSNDPDFSKLINKYLVEDTLEIVNNYNLDLVSTIDELKARQKFSTFLSGIIPLEKEKGE